MPSDGCASGGIGTASNSVWSANASVTFVNIGLFQALSAPGISTFTRTVGWSAGTV